MSYQGRECKSFKTTDSGDRCLGLTPASTQLGANYINTLGLSFLIWKMGLLIIPTVANAVGAPPSFPFLSPSGCKAWLLLVQSCPWNMGVALPEMQEKLRPTLSGRSELQLMTDMRRKPPCLK